MGSSQLLGIIAAYILHFDPTEETFELIRLRVSNSFYLPISACSFREQGIQGNLSFATSFLLEFMFKTVKRSGI
jgi:hypothetical protein